MYVYMRKNIFEGGRPQRTPEGHLFNQVSDALSF